MSRVNKIVAAILTAGRLGTIGQTTTRNEWVDEYSRIFEEVEEDERVRREIKDADARRARAQPQPPLDIGDN